MPRRVFARAIRLRDRLRWFLLPLRYARGYAFARNWKECAAAKPSESPSSNTPSPENPLWNYFTGLTEGHGIWKWEHYFDIYHRHLSRFVGSPVNLLEIGIYSGGSLNMWSSYFGDRCHIYGVDIEEACMAYESENVTVFIGDQGDPGFWTRFNSEVQGIDILIDDGGHMPNQQMVTLEKMLPQLRPGGVYLCEDVHGIHHEFVAYANGLIAELNKTSSRDVLGRETTPFQSSCHSIHFYPYVVVIEKHLHAPSSFDAPKHGTQWQPFFTA
ncbi:MAG: class I SAM-dependent methyltransferase [Verrucomicrobia bacterium]|nr:class I SAM-dependent methyltransferase [Verrucomicrobiota bacterium]MDA1086525.1 class I SAM-dependent methyltransferase [Verrucomicrobiota bacterium]